MQQELSPEHPLQGSALVDEVVLDGSGVAVDMDIVPELDTTYMFHKNWGIEAIAGIANHNVKLKGPGPTLSSLGLSDGFKVVDTWVLPPTVTLQYHLMPEN